MLKKGFVLILGRVLGAVFGLLSGVIMARVLGAEKLGQYNVFLSTQTIIVTLVTLGIGNASIYFINRELISEKEIITSFLKLFLLLSILTSIVFYIIVSLNNNYFGDIDSSHFFVFLVGTASIIIASILRPVLYACNRVNEVTFTNLLPPFVLLIGLFILFLQNDMSVSFVLSVWGVGNFLAVLFLIYFHRSNISSGIQLCWKNMLMVVKYGIKLSASNFLFVLISNASIFALKKLADDGFTDVGLYSRAVAISSIVLMIPNSIGPMLFSRWSHADIDYQSEIQKTLRVFNSISFFCIIITSLFSSLIIFILYGSDFLSIKTSLIILLCSLLFQGMSEVFNNFLASQGRAKLTLYSLMASFIVIILVNILLIPTMGINGAAIAVLASCMVNTCILYLFVRRIIPINLLDSLIVKKTDVDQFIKFKKK